MSPQNIHLRRTIFPFSQVAFISGFWARAESDDHSSYFEHFPSNIPNKADPVKNSVVHNRFDVKIDDKGRKQVPNLFIFKKLPVCRNDSTESSTNLCKKRHSRNSKFVLVDTIYREEVKSTEKPFALANQLDIKDVSPKGKSDTNGKFRQCPIHLSITNK